MSGGQLPPSSPQAPVEGGRDSFATQSRAVRRLEARMAAERRRAGEVPLSGLTSLVTPSRVDVPTVDERSQPERTRIRRTLDAVLRRSGRTRRR